jgi:cyclopropane-fatty-acyl-phospholipid synthase
MFNQIRLSAWSSGVRNKLSLPLRVELWNGQRVDFSSEPPRVTIRIPDARALRYLLKPSLYNLGTAYVEGAIDVSGRANDMIAIVGALAANSMPRNRLANAWRKLTHTRDSDAAAVRYHYDLSNEF